MGGRILAVSLAAIVAAGASVVLTPGTGAAAARAVTMTASTVAATRLYANASGLVMDAGGARKSGVTVRVHKDGTANGKRWLREKDRTIRPAYDTRLCLDVPRAWAQPGGSATQTGPSACGRYPTRAFA